MTVDQITIENVSQVNQVIVESTNEITVITVGEQGLQGASGLLGVQGGDANAVLADDGGLLMYDGNNAQWLLTTQADASAITSKIKTLTFTAGGASVTGVLDEDDLTSNSDTKLATQQSIKAYVDSSVETVNSLSEIIALGNTTSGNDIAISTDDKVTFRDSAIYINSSADGQLDIVADTEIQIAATTIDINGAVNASGEIAAASLDISGNVDIDGVLEADAITVDGNALVLTANDYTDADHSKLDGIEAGATADQTDAEIRAAVEAASDSNVFTDADHSKLDGIEANATSDQTDAEIRAAVDAATDSNVFTDADHTKLNAIEASADVTDTTNVTAAGALMDSELSDLAGVKGVTISTLQVKPSEGAFADGDKTKLDGIETSADVTDATNVTAAGALMDSEVTDLAGIKSVTISTLQVKPSEGAFANGDKTKLDGIETNATADQTNAEIRSAVEAASDSNVFTDADHSKLNGIEASADVTDSTNVVAALTAGTGITIAADGTIEASPLALTTVQVAANQSAQLALTAQEGDVVVRSDENKSYMHNGGTAGTMADYTLLATPTDAVLSVNGNTGAITADQIATAVEAATGSNTFTDADHSKLDAIEANADVTDVTNVTAAGALMDSELTDLAGVKGVTVSTLQVKPSEGAFVDGDKTKLDGIEASATADQTDAEIRSAVEAATDSNVFTDADHTKLNGIEASATADQTAEEIKTLLENGIDSVHYVDGSIDTVHIGDDQVTEDKLANTINSAIAANTAKTGITTEQASAIIANTAKVTNATHTGEVTGDTALTIADNVVDEANLKVSNSPVNGYALTAQSGATGGLTWAEISGGGGAGTLTDTLSEGNRTTGAEKIEFRDAEIYINSSADGQLDIVADTEIQIAATTIDINGAVALNGALTGITNITLSGELDAATGDFSGDVDVDGTLEADAITLNGTALGSLYSPIAGSSSIVTTGAINSGSITSGFGSIDNGASAITTTGTITGGTIASTGDITVTGTVDGRDIATDGTKLDGIEASADVTDATNVTAAGALMDSEVTNLAQVKAFDSADYATAAQGTTADAALPKSGGTMTGTIASFESTGIDDNATAEVLQLSDTEVLIRKPLELLQGQANIFTDGSMVISAEDNGGAGNMQFKVNALNSLTLNNDNSATFGGNITVGGTVDGRDVATDGTKLDGIEAGADVTDATNVASAGAAMLTGATFTGTISGNGSGLTALNGSNISTGTIAAARVATLNQNTTGSSGSCTGNAATATLAADSTLAGGLAVGTGVNSGVNEIVRTNGSGYTDFGWINTVSGVASGTPTRIYCSQDAYIRYYTPASLAPYILNQGSTKNSHVHSGSEITTGTIAADRVATLNQNTTGSSGSCTGNAATATAATRADLIDVNNYTSTTNMRILGSHQTGVSSNVYSNANMYLNCDTGIINASGFYASGNITAYSDKRVKTNFEVIPNALEKVSKLSGYTFDRTDLEKDEDGNVKSVARQTGVIAQEVLEVLPEVVSQNPEDGMYGVAYGNMVGLLIEAIKELKAEVEELKGNK